MIISLTGLMGSGKSSVGKELSELLCCRFVDLDEEIQTQEGLSVKEIFDLHGEEGFRRIEESVLRKVLADCIPDKDITVLSTGGGTVMTSSCANLLKENTVCIYLRTSTGVLAERLKGKTCDRPLLAGSRTSLESRIRELAEHRKAIYERTAHIIIDTDFMSAEDIAQKIFSRKNTFII